MDYTTKSWSFKLRKAFRYSRLYGLRRTWIKIRGQYHMNRRYPSRPIPPTAPASGGHVGLLGCGNFAFSNIAYYLRRAYGRKVLRGCMDIDIHRAASLADHYSLRFFTDQAERVLADPEIDLVFIASNHASHAEYAVRALRAGKAVHIEKPHCVSHGQLLELCRTLRETQGKVSLGFNRPGSELGQEIRRCMDSQQGASMLNWFVAGHQIDPEHWYFKEDEGGRVLGNLCHWTDFIYHLVPAENRFPITITPTRADRSDCDIAVTYLFGDGSIAAITFSAKGHSFEGVRERFTAHKGNLLVFLDDFKTLTLEVGDRKTTRVHRFRDHGHKRRILGSYRMATDHTEAASLAYIWETGLLFLETREALRSRSPRRIEDFSNSFPE